ncbi:hypothetical protein PLESTB_001198100 [Pleodorina starrii]|uniref:Uncharacterized protein n=1 Tax=Pleodorina starrii TaxID=330485 RepID=A0A9W6BT02_9CHLO|nr:hypothetical protein PLESTM_001835700 [Pleodorina starrii]GLC57202.1 hypothetical protein PLESTB_001198100 [Pleodorina starrii]GLC71416.1 hypothetical protein PLESTF_001113700 [Pleodorina starrii]
MGPNSVGTSPRSPRLQRLQSLERLFSQPSIHATLFEDKVFGHDDWRRHRNAAWRHRVEPTVFCRVAVGFIWQLLAVAVVAVAVGLTHTLMRGRDSFLSSERLVAPFSMITFALSLLLVFKTNSSYSRWWEGRIIWGQIVNFARNYARQALMWFPADRPELQAAAVRWAAAAPRVLLAHVREGTDAVTEARGILTHEEVEWLRSWSNGPLGAGTALGQLVVAAGLPQQLEAEMQKQVELYTNCAGGCERIFKTPIPPAYARHTSRFLMLYVVTSPVLLWPSTRWLTPLVAVVIAFLLLGVENIGVQVEEPFHVLPLNEICRAIEANVFEMERAFSTGPGGRPDAAELAAAAAAGRPRHATAAAASGGDAAASWRRAGTGAGAGPAGSPNERRLSVLLPSSSTTEAVAAAAAAAPPPPAAGVVEAAVGPMSGTMVAQLGARLSAPGGGGGGAAAAAGRPGFMRMTESPPAART